MPTPDGRQWLSSTEIAERITAHLTEVGALKGPPDRIVDAVRRAYESTGYTLEFKILRLVEQLKESVVHADPEFHNPGCGACANLFRAFKDIYRADILEFYDEEGNYTGPAEE